MARRIIFRVHALRRMFERNITVEDVALVVRIAELIGGQPDIVREPEFHTLLGRASEVIENYPDDNPYPSRLLLGWCQERPLHVVVAENAQDDEWIIITAYEPDPAQWDADFKRRKP